MTDEPVPDPEEPVPDPEVANDLALHPELMPQEEGEIPADAPDPEHESQQFHGDPDVPHVEQA